MRAINGRPVEHADTVWLLVSLSRHSTPNSDGALRLGDRTNASAAIRRVAGAYECCTQPGFPRTSAEYAELGRNLMRRADLTNEQDQVPATLKFEAP